MREKADHLHVIGMQKLIGVIGSSVCSKDNAYEVGKNIAKSGNILICGGLGGVMELRAGVLMRQVGSHNYWNGYGKKI